MTSSINLPRKFEVPDLKSGDIIGKTVIVTGASRGIGKSTAELFSRLGLKVGIVARDTDELYVTAKEIGCVAFPCDVSKENDVKEVFRKAKKMWRKVDIVVANAGFIKPSPIKDTTLSDWQKHLNVNLTGVFLFAREFLRQKIKPGCFITVSSTSGMKGRSVWSAYSASKAGAINFSEALAEEAKKMKVKVYDVAPSRTATKMRRSLFRNEDQSKMNQPEDVARLIAFCCSSKNIYPEGTSFWINNKITMLWKKYSFIMKEQ
jgi:3-oxoacyl-[acyl-carrier protein] reductase